MNKIIYKKYTRRGFFFKLNIIFLVLFICEIAAFGCFLLSTNAGIMNIIALATTVRPETFTELYFTDHLQLPSTVTTNQTITFKFTTHNLEYQTYSYPYEVYLDENGQKTEIDKGTFTLKQNQYKTIAETYTLQDNLTRGEIVVNLQNKNQQIDFWVKGEDENAQ